MTIRVFEAFAGVGSQRMALRNLGIDHEVVAIAEIDKFAIKSYEAIHGETNNLGDISQLGMEDIPDHDLFTYSFPCQDISVAGKGLGLDEGSDTRSGLLWECQKVIYGKRPKYLLLENVKNLVGKKHKHNFDKWLEWLEKQGYTNYWQVLNAKDYGVPQNRERVFVVSILGRHEPYEFPEPIELELRLKDVLEDVVDEKFYLGEEQMKRLTGNSFHQANVRLQGKDYSDTLLARDYKDPKCVRVGGIFDKDGTKHQAGAVWDKEQLSPTLDTMQGGWRQPSVVVDNSNVKPIKNEVVPEVIGGIGEKNFGSQYRQGNRIYDVNKIATALTASPAGNAGGYTPLYGDPESVVVAASRGRNPENPSDRTVSSPTEQRLEINKQGTSNTITTVQKDNYVVEGISDKFSFVKRKSREIIAEKGRLPEYYNPYNKSEIIDVAPTITTNSDRASNSGQVMINKNLRIRKLTPKECWRLMGFSDDDFHKAEEVNSNTQLYKQAGNSIVVDVLEGIFKQLLEVAE